MADDSGQKLKLIAAVVMLVLALGLLAWHFGLFGGGGGGGSGGGKGTPPPSETPNRATPDGTMGS